MDVNDLKEQLIAWWTAVIRDPVEMSAISEYPGICPCVFLTSEHSDANRAPIWRSERAFGAVYLWV